MLDVMLCDGPRQEPRVRSSEDPHSSLRDDLSPSEAMREPLAYAAGGHGHAPVHRSPVMAVVDPTPYWHREHDGGGGEGGGSERAGGGQFMNKMAELQAGLSDQQKSMKQKMREELIRDLDEQVSFIKWSQRFTRRSFLSTGCAVSPSLPQQRSH
jgi:hypothetical protein